MESSEFLSKFRSVAFAIALMLPAAAQAFTLNTDRDKLEGWDADLLSIDYDYDGCPEGISRESLDAAFDAAIQLWNTVPSSRIRLQRGAEVDVGAKSASTRASSGNPVIVCDPEFASRTEQDADQVPALTVNLLLEGETSRIAYGAVLLNAQPDASANIENVEEHRLRIVLAHEIGHLLGLGHSQDSTALMYFDLTDKDRLALSRDDMEGMAFLYPRRELVGTQPFGCGTLAGPNGTNGEHTEASRTASIGAGLVFLAIIFVWRAARSWA